MAYSDDIAAIGADHLWKFDGNSNDDIGTANGTNSGVLFSNPAIAEDASNCMTVNGVADRVTLPTPGDISPVTAEKYFGGFISISAVQLPPKRLYGEGNNAIVFQLVLSFGNKLMLEVRSGANFTVQVYSDRVLQPGRVYHVLGAFEGSSRGNFVALWLDGVQQTSSSPADGQPDTQTLSARGAGEFGDAVGTTGISGTIIGLTGCEDASYQHWASWNGNGINGTQVRETLFEKGALASQTIASGTEAAMQTALNAFSGTTRGDEPINIRIEAKSGGGDLALTATNIEHSPLASVHYQYMGTDTLTLTLAGSSDGSIISTPNGGTVVLVQPQTLTITALDAASRAAIVGARVYIEAAAGGPLAAGTVIMNTLTNSSGVATAAFSYSADQPIIGRIRQGTNTPLYKTSQIIGPLTATPFDVDILMVKDQ